MTKFICLLCMAVCLLCCCSSDDDSLDDDFYVIKKEVSNHSYIIFKNGARGFALSVVHDPDCSCLINECK